jgi:hypothetical protein
METDYKIATNGIDSAFDSIRKLGLPRRVQAQVTHLMYMAALDTQNGMLEKSRVRGSELVASLGLPQELKTQVTDLVDKATQETHNAMVAAQGQISRARYGELIDGLHSHVHKYGQRAHELDPTGSYKKFFSYRAAFAESA